MRKGIGREVRRCIDLFLKCVVKDGEIRVCGCEYKGRDYMGVDKI